MNPKKFYASNSRDALRKVRETLGPNAIVLSNRPVSNGVEVTAVLETELASLNDPTEEGLSAPSADHSVTTYASSSNQGEERPSLSVSPPSPTPIAEPADRMMDSPAPKSRPTRASVSEQVLYEISDMKNLLETQLSLVAWGDLQRRDPERVKLTKHLLNCGFSPVLTRALIEAVPQKNTFDTGLQWIRNVLNRNLSAIESGTDFVDNGGVYALLGPTGVGKTTTTAKLAARYVLRHGTSKLALISMDSYRMGAGEQLRVYGKMLGVPVYSVRDSTDLQIKLEELSAKHMILIDTVGISQRDQYLAEHLRGLQQTQSPIRPLLLLNATNSSAVLDEVTSTYQSHLPLHGVILTKTDEAPSLGPMMDLLIRRQLTVHFLTNGQRVPEDLYQPNRQYLLHKSLKYDLDQSSFMLDDDELPLMMAESETTPEEKHRLLGLE